MKKNRKMLVYRTNNNQASFNYDFFSNMDFEIIEFNNFQNIIKSDDNWEDSILIAEGKSFIELDNSIKELFKKKYPKIKIVITGEFSESYLYGKVMKEGCDEFIITPFGKKEAENLISRLFL